MSEPEDPPRTYYCTNCLTVVETVTEETPVPHGTYRRWKCPTCNRVFMAVTMTSDASPARPDDGPAPQHRPDFF